MGIEVTGKLHTIFETKQMSERFSKREFVLELVDNPKYPQVVLFQLTGDRCTQLDGLNVGEQVRIEFSLRGREWKSPQGETKYFNSLDVWKVEPARGGGGGSRDGGGGGGRGGGGGSRGGRRRLRPARPRRPAARRRHAARRRWPQPQRRRHPVLIVSAQRASLPTPRCGVPRQRRHQDRPQAAAVGFEDRLQTFRIAFFSTMPNRTIDGERGVVVPSRNRGV